QTDFAIITVAADLGPQKFDFPPSAFSGGTVNITGYTRQVPGYNIVSANTPQFNDIGTVFADDTYAALDWNTITDSNSLRTFHGERGGPVWTMAGSTATAVGIVSGGDDFGLTGTDVKLTPTIVATIQGWEADAQTILGKKVSADFTGSGTSDILYAD